MAKALPDLTTNRLRTESSEETLDTGVNTIVDMLGRIKETNAHVLQLPTNDPFLPELHQIGDSIEDITQLMTPKDDIFYPKNMSKGVSEDIQMLQDRIKKKYGKDKVFVYIARCLSVTLNIGTGVKRPSSVICDVCIVSEMQPPLVLTITKTEHDDASFQYNLMIVKGLVSRVRNFTEEHISALYGTLPSTCLQTDSTFESAVRDLENRSSALCNPDSIAMTETKFKNVLKALAASLAESPAVKYINASSSQSEGMGEDSDEDDMWFLTKEQFHLLTENIDTQGIVVVWAGPHSGSTTLLVEVAGRLEKGGRTMLIAGSEETCITARKYGVCSEVITREEFLKIHPDVLDVDHVVAEDVPEHLLRNCGPQRHIWLCMKLKDQTLTQEKPIKYPVYPKVSRPKRSSSESSVVDKEPTLLRKISLNIETDKADTWVYDFTVVQVDGVDVIVAMDRANRLLKTYSVQDEIESRNFMSIDSKASGMASIRKKVAITVPTEYLIRVIAVSSTGDLQPHSVIRTERHYYDIAPLGQEKLVVCAPKDGMPCVDIIDCSGQILNSFTKDEEGNNLFSHPIIVETMGNNILVYDKNNSTVRCITQRGQSVFKFRKTLKDPCGIAVTPAGDIFIADSRQHSVMILNQEGKMIKEVLSRKNVIFPYRLCFEAASNRLYVAGFYKEISIFEYK